MSEQKLRKDAERALHAQQLLDNELLTEAFAKLKASYLSQWEGTTVDQQFLREKYWIAHRVVGVVEAHLASVVQNGKVAKAELNKLAETKTVAA